MLVSSKDFPPHPNRAPRPLRVIAIHNQNPNPRLYVLALIEVARKIQAQQAEQEEKSASHPA